jgi:predicted metal-dependent phosphotriesterase family hydrolase
VVNHPEWATVDMSIDDQKRLAQFDVFFERCYARNVGGQYDKNFRRNLDAMEALGFESTIVATDGGQVENPMWSEALAEYIGFLRQAGVPQTAVDRMTKTNPATVLGLQ